MSAHLKNSSEKLRELFIRKELANIEKKRKERMQDTDKIDEVIDSVVAGSRRFFAKTAAVLVRAAKEGEALLADIREEEPHLKVVPPLSDSPNVLTKTHRVRAIVSREIDAVSAEEAQALFNAQLIEDGYKI